MKCPNCNAVISPHAKRCEYCGEYFLGNESVEAPAEKEYQLCFDPEGYEPYCIERDEHGRTKRVKARLIPGQSESITYSHNQPESRKVLAVYEEEAEVFFPPPILLKQ